MRDIIYASTFFSIDFLLILFFTANAIDSDMYQTPIWYLLIRGVQSFYEIHQRIPGAHNDELDSDIPLLKVFFSI